MWGHFANGLRGERGGRLTRRAFLQDLLLKAAAVAGTAWGSSRLGWWNALAGRSASGGVRGVVRDLLTGRPIPGAKVGVALGSRKTPGNNAAADGRGGYQLALPAGRYEVQASAPGYIAMARSGQVVPDGGEAVVDFEMIPANPTPAEQEAIYAKVVQSPEWPAVGTELTALALQESAATVVTVPETIWVRLPNGTVTEMPLDDYLRHVVPAEMPASWPQQALRVQAVAARSYAVAYGATPDRPICTDTRCQVYGDPTYATTDEAVWCTHNQIATYNGKVISAFYFAQCNGVTTRNSEEALANTGYGGTCTVQGWSYVAYCRARSCSGHSPYPYSSCGYHGHGVGMCQHGAKGFAEQGLSYDQILARFYTGIQLYTTPSPTPQPTWPPNGYLAQTGTPITLSWTGVSDTYAVVLVDGGGNVLMSDSGGFTSAPVPPLPAGTYYWYVTGYSGGCSHGTSATWRFTLADRIYKQTLPAVSKG